MRGRHENHGNADPGPSSSQRHAKTRRVTTPKEQTGEAWILQWNCHSLAPKKAELVQRIQTQGRPIAMLLQEVGSTEIAITGYDHHTEPTIRHRAKRGPHKTDAEIARGQAAVYIDKTLPQVKLDLARWCNEQQEIVGVRTIISKRPFVLVSVYVRPRRGAEARDRWEWIDHVRSLYLTMHSLSGRLQRAASSVGLHQ